MAAHYRIIEESHDAFYVEASRPFLWFLLWTRVRDCHAASQQGYSYSAGSSVRYRTAEAAVEAVAYLEAAETTYAYGSHVLAYQ